MIDFTEAAILAFKTKIAALDPNTSIRLGVKGNGCLGYKNIIDFTPYAASPNDYIILIDGLRFHIDNKSYPILDGSTIDWKKTFMFEGFDIINNNVEKYCSCGNSFSIKDKPT